MSRIFLRIFLISIMFLSGCSDTPREASIVLINEPITYCNRSVGGRFIWLGGARFFDMQTRSSVVRLLPQTENRHSSIWLTDELLIASPRDASGNVPSSLNNYHVNPGGFLLDVATGIVTDVTTLPQATQEQLRLDTAAAYQRDYGSPLTYHSPNGQYAGGFNAIYRRDPITSQETELLVTSGIDLVSECIRPWEPDSSGIIFLERISVSGWNLITEPGPLRFLPVP